MAGTNEFFFFFHPGDATTEVCADCRQDDQFASGVLSHINRLFRDRLSIGRRTQASAFCLSKSNRTILRPSPSVLLATSDREVCISCREQYFHSHPQRDKLRSCCGTRWHLANPRLSKAVSVLHTQV